MLVRTVETDFEHVSWGDLLVSYFAEELERRLISARVAVNEYMERNLDDQEACTILQVE